MSDGRQAGAIDRLPWLDDEPESAIREPFRARRAWVPALIAVLAVLGSWLVSRGLPRLDPNDTPPVARNSPSGEANVPLPDIADEIVPPLDQRAPGAVLAIAEPTTAEPRSKPTPPPPVVRNGRVIIRHMARPRASQVDRKLDYWPATESSGASGRMVRIGTFASRAQAKKGWRAVMGIYPGMGAIPAAVVPVRSTRDGRTYYRLQMGTTSQAQSEILCQRMRIIGQSCVVIGLGG